LKPAPYPADTRAKGWRFELDLEQVMQSDTWALAAADVRPWLLMLWTTAWQQTPCGSMPGDDALICARLGMQPKTFAKAKAVLMRGWWAADDGRLYHPTITARVLAMLSAKDKERTRKAEWRAKMEAERKAKESGDRPDMSHGTGAGQTEDSYGTDDTGTGTGTGTGFKSGDSAHATPGQACIAMKSVGMQSVSPSHPTLIALLEAGITLPELEQAARDAVAKGKTFAYALATAEGRRRDAAKVGALPTAVANKQEILEAGNFAAANKFVESLNAGI
jgi:hypothetical protein